jgi:hypothetical protein
MAHAEQKLLNPSFLSLSFDFQRNYSLPLQAFLRANPVFSLQQGV